MCQKTRNYAKKILQKYAEKREITQNYFSSEIRGKTRNYAKKNSSEKNAKLRKIIFLQKYAEKREITQQQKNSGELFFLSNFAFFRVFLKKNNFA
jgi:hypothetical protein